jgi:hypothetical protein
LGYKSLSMESSTGFAESPARRDPGAIRLTQAGLLVAALGALLVVFGLIPTVGLVLTVLGAIAAARGGIGNSWYTTVVAGAGLEVLAKLLAESAETLGGWLAVIASIFILVGVCLGYPTGARRR